MKNELNPINGDIIIIGSDDISYVTAELASKSAALYTLEHHVDHEELESITNNNTVTNIRDI